MPCNAIPWRSMRYLKLITLFLISSNSLWFNNHSSSVRTFTPERCATRYIVYVRFFFSWDFYHAFQVCVHLEEKQEKGSKNQANIHFRTLVTRTSFMWLQSENSFHTQAHNHTQTDILTAGTNRRFNSANETNGMHTPHTKLWQFEWTRRRFRSKR